jgi:hypothetical protein
MGVGVDGGAILGRLLEEMAGKMRGSAYRQEMDMIEDRTPAGWLASLAQSKAEVEAGQIVPLEPILEELRASIARMTPVMIV